MQLRRADCELLLGAVRAAASMGQPMNRFITIAWGLGGIEPQDSVKATGAFVRLAREWHRQRGHRMPWTWVQEFGPKFGAHCHLLLHVPAELEFLFRTMPRRWTKSIMGGHYPTGAEESQRLASAYAKHGLSGHYEAEVLAKLHYMMKCAPAALEGPLGMIGRGHKPWGQSCLTYGKRAAAWQGWKAAGDMADPKA